MPLPSNVISRTSGQSISLTFDVEGERAVREKLSRIRRRELLRIAKKAARPAGKPILATARELAPKSKRQRGTTTVRVSGTGYQPGRKTLARNIKLKVSRSRLRPGVVIETGTREKMGIPLKGNSYYPAAQEYGWEDSSGKRHEGTPYMRPALERHERSSADILISIFLTELEATVSR